MSVHASGYRAQIYTYGGGGGTQSRKSAAQRLQTQHTFSLHAQILEKNKRLTPKNLDTGPAAPPARP